MKNRVRSYASAAVALALGLSGCGVVEEGNQQSWSFATRYLPEEVRSRAALQLSRTGYRTLRNEERFIEAEKENAFDDVLRVFIESTNAEGTQVRVQAFTRGARSVSSTALSEGQALVDALMTRTP